MRKNLIYITLGIILLSGCKDYLGNKTDISFIDLPEFQDRDAAYVPIQPVIDGFVKPSHVLAGFDGLIYVVDEGSEEIICLDEAGRELGRLRVPGVTSVAQDRRLDLLAVGRVADPQENGGPLACVYRIKQVNGGSYGLNFATFTDTIIHPYSFGYSYRGRSQEVAFNAVGVMADNTFYITRTGPEQTVNRVEGPDDAIILMSDSGKFVTTVNVNAGGIFLRDFFKQPQAITTLAQPPQIQVNNSKSIFVTSWNEENLFKFRRIDFIETDAGANFEPANIPLVDTALTVSNAFSPNRFVKPGGVTVAGGGLNYFFVTDLATDSVYQFTFNGNEGVPPQASAVSRKQIPVSFGGTGESLTQFRGPVSVAWLRGILYVVDQGNRRLLRFQLTTDI